MKSFWNESDRREILERLRRIDPETPPMWGKMTADKIVCHLGDQLRLAYAEIPAEKPRGALRFWPINALIIRVLPWPKGAPTPQESWTTAPKAWQEDLRTLEALVEEFGRKPREGPWPDHGLFGKMSGSLWGILSYRHFDHHLRQFGV